MSLPMRGDDPSLSGEDHLLNFGQLCNSNEDPHIFYIVMRSLCKLGLRVSHIMVVTYYDYSLKI